MLVPLQLSAWRSANRNVVLIPHPVVSWQPADDGCGAQGSEQVAAEEEEWVEVEGLPEIVWGENEITVKRRTVLVRRKKGARPAAEADSKVTSEPGHARGSNSVTADRVAGPHSVASLSTQRESQGPPGGPARASRGAGCTAAVAPRPTFEQQQLLYRTSMRLQQQQRRRIAGGMHAAVMNQEFCLPVSQSRTWPSLCCRCANGTFAMPEHYYGMCCKEHGQGTETVLSGEGRESEPLLPV